MRTIKMQVSGKGAETILNSVPRNAALEIYPGTLLDSFAIDFGESGKYNLGRKICRRFMVGREIYLNEWSSAIEITMTDSEQVYNNYIDKFSKVGQE